MGWDIYSWNRYADPPPSDALGWYELTPAQRDAAAHLCYFPASWDEGDALQVDGFPLQRPGFRYRPWTALDNEARRTAEDGLKYGPLTWNVPGLAPAESRAWDDLTSHEQTAARSLGFAEVAWDCWQNHFRGYRWEGLVFYGLDLPYAALGWTRQAWDGDGIPPRTHGADWKDLTPGERRAAAELCYFRDNWDGASLSWSLYRRGAPSGRFTVPGGNCDGTPSGTPRHVRGGIHRNPPPCCERACVQFSTHHGFLRQFVLQGWT